MIGQSAPDFSLKASDGTTVSLKELAGRKVVLVFYVINNTPG
jgi:thioredoxin-dependent peroxiredoxin